MGCFCFCRGYYQHARANMNGTRESRNSSSYDWTQDIQLHGLLYKKPINHQSNKWTKRSDRQPSVFFVIVKVSVNFILDTEIKQFREHEKRGYIVISYNVHMYICTCIYIYEKKMCVCILFMHICTTSIKER